MEKEIRCNSNGCNCTKEERATNNGNCKHSIIVYMENKQPIGADCVCDLGSEKHYHPQCEYLMENKDWREQFEEVFYAIMGLETDPEGVPNMYLIRDEDDNVVNGIDFTPEKKAIISFIKFLLKSKQEEIEEKISKKRRLVDYGSDELEQQYEDRGFNSALDDLKPIISNLFK